MSGFVEPITKELPLEYAIEMNRLIELQMEGSCWARAGGGSLATPSCRFPTQPRRPGGSPTCAGSIRTPSRATSTPRRPAAPQLLDLDVAGLAVVTESGIEIERAPEGIRFEPLTEDDPRLYSLVGWDEKFAAHNAAVWKHGLLVHVPKGVVLEKPLYVRIASSVEGSALFWRLLVDRRGAVAVHADRGVLLGAARSARLLERGRRAVRRARRRSSSTSRSRTSRRRPGTSRPTTRASSATRELDWVAGGFGSKNGKIRIQNDLNGPGATSRVTGAYFADGNQHLDYDTFQEHIAPSTESDFAFKGALREHAHAVWRGMIRVEEDAQKTNAYQENRNLLLSADAHADSIPGLEIMANDVRCTHGATIGRVNRDELFYLMTRGLSRAGGRAADRARVLPGHPRPDRARAGARGARRRARGADPAGLSPSSGPRDRLDDRGRVVPPRRRAARTSRRRARPRRPAPCGRPRRSPCTPSWRHVPSAIVPGQPVPGARIPFSSFHGLRGHAYLADRGERHARLAGERAEPLEQREPEDERGAVDLEVRHQCFFRWGGDGWMTSCIEA